MLTCVSIPHQSSVPKTLFHSWKWPLDCHQAWIQCRSSFLPFLLLEWPCKFHWWRVSGLTMISWGHQRLKYWFCKAKFNYRIVSGVTFECMCMYAWHMLLNFECKVYQYHLWLACTAAERFLTALPCSTTLWLTLERRQLLEMLCSQWQIEQMLLHQIDPRGFSSDIQFFQTLHIKNVINGNTIRYASGWLKEVSPCS